MCGFLEQVVCGCPANQQIHIILDNLPAHKTAKVETFLREHPQAQLHFTPTYSSWLESGGNLVLQAPARPHHPGRVHLGSGSGPEDPALSPAVLQHRQAFKLKYSDVRIPKCCDVLQTIC
ncbi:MAG: transposase [Bryobacterales bacterium]|nr:transposase [Bryobacterales bacterium]MBV9397737.1 transposase [Bryobacterales bacterium]